MEPEQGQRRLAGFMLRHYADRVAATHKAGRSTILCHFDHESRCFRCGIRAGRSVEA